MLQSNMVDHVQRVDNAPGIWFRALGSLLPCNERTKREI
jgi:hypothetical protein